MQTATLREIRFGSAEFQQECVLRQETLRKPLGLDLYAEDLAKEGDQWHFGLFDADGTLIGCVVVRPLSVRDAKIRQMAVAPHCQGQGHGRRMLEELEKRLAARGFSRLVLHARSPMRGFYEKLGYAVVGDEFLEVSIPHVRMEKVVGYASA
jgi:predicted GNAT family N-acyltransferase